MARKTSILFSVLVCGAACGCAEQAGVVFPPTTSPIVWPGGNEPARIRYVGQLSSSADLKPGRSSLDMMNQALFGKPQNHAMATPFAVCTDGADRVFVADSATQVVRVFDLESRRYAEWKPQEKQPPLLQPVSVAWDPSGRLLVSDSAAGAIFVFDQKGQYAGQIGAGVLKRPCGLAIQSSAGRIYVADAAAHQVVVFSTAGQEITRIGRRGTALGEFNFPVDVAVDHQGRVYVADALNFRVQQFASDLKPVRIIGGRGDTPGYFAQPKCLDVDGEDHLYVVDNRFEVIQIFDAEGQLLLNFGQEGRGPGAFWLPTDISIDPKNRIWIADSYNRRVQVFEYLPVTATPATMPETKP